MTAKTRKFGLCIFFAFMSDLALHLSLNIVTNEQLCANMGVENPGPVFRLLWDIKVSLGGYRTESWIILAALSILFYIIWKYEPGFSCAAAVTAALFSFFQVFGTSFNAVASWDLIFHSGRSVVKAALSFIGHGILFYFAIQGVFILLKRVHFVKKDTKITSWFTTNRRSLFTVAGLILVMWLPYFIASFPGLVNYDFIDMLDSFYGRNTNSLRVVNLIDPDVTLNNNNPVLQVLIAVAFMKIGDLLGSPYAGLFLFTTVQAILFALVLSYAIRFLAAKNINKKIRAGVLLIYGLIPLHANYAFATLKDTNFSFVTLLYLLLIIEMVLDPDGFVSNRKNLVKLAVTALLMVFLRNNGVYIVALSAVAFLIAYRKQIKQLLIPLLTPVIIYMLVTNVVYPALKISPGSPAEAYSIPMQQIARLVKEHGPELTDKDREAIDNVLDYSKLASIYNPQISDPVKVTYKKNCTNEQFKDFMGVWAKYLTKYPGLYVQATMSNCYGYFYPEAQNWLNYTTIAPPGEAYGLKPFKSLETIRGEMTQMSLVVRSLPGIGMFLSIGFNVWCLICMTAALIRFRQKKKSLMMFPMFVLLLTAVAGPVNTMMRYVYPVILSAPLYAVMTGFIVCSGKNTSSGRLTDEA